MSTDGPEPANPSWFEEHLAKNPLNRFSIYTDSQSKIVLRIGDEILANLEGWRSPNNATDIMRVHNDFWLWVLASYEVVRTMAQCRRCFSPRLTDEILQLRDRLRVVRVPFAKQELPLLKGQKPKDAEAVYSELSMSGIYRDPPDVKYRVRGEEVSGRGLVEHFGSLFRSITPEDVLADLRELYGPRRDAGDA